MSCISHDIYTSYLILLSIIYERNLKNYYCKGLYEGSPRQSFVFSENNDEGSGVSGITLEELVSFNFTIYHTNTYISVVMCNGKGDNNTTQKTNKNPRLKRMKKRIKSSNKYK